MPKINQKRLAAFQKKRGQRNAEELGGELDGLAALSSTFLDRFIHHFRRSTRTVVPQARHFFKGLLQCPNKRNLERLEETVPDTEYQALHHFLSVSAWDDQPLCNQIAKDADRLLGGGSDTGLFIDPSAFPKKGRHSVGTQRQWCGRLGKLENCQLGVFAALGRGHHACLIDKRLYLPKEWTDSSNRCQRAGVPESQVVYRSTAKLALEIIERADANHVRYAWIGVDAEFGKQPWFLKHLDQAGKVFMADVQSSTHVQIQHPSLNIRSKVGDSQKALRLKKKAVVLKAWAKRQPDGDWLSLTIREGRKGPLTVEILHRHIWVLDEVTGEYKAWHLVVRRDPLCHQDKDFTYKYSLSNAPLGTSAKTLALRQAQRFWVEHAIKQAKQDAGMGEYQVRGWRGWHHHVSMSMLAALFLLEARLKHQTAWPGLSNRDLRDILIFLLPRKIHKMSQLLEQIYKRHQRQNQAKLAAIRSIRKQE